MVTAESASEDEGSAGTRDEGGSDIRAALDGGRLPLGARDDDNNHRGVRMAGTAADRIARSGFLRGAGQQQHQQHQQRVNFDPEAPPPPSPIYQGNMHQTANLLEKPEIDKKVKVYEQFASLFFYFYFFSVMRHTLSFI